MSLKYQLFDNFDLPVKQLLTFIRLLVSMFDQSTGFLFKTI